VNLANIENDCIARRDRCEEALTSKEYAHATILML